MRCEGTEGARASALVRNEPLVDGLRTPILHAGDPAADEAVVFVHGNPGSGEDWRALLVGVGAYARALAPDMPGFGRADKPPAGFDYTVEGYAHHLRALLDIHGVRRAHLVGHDFGGPWMLTWAAMQPHRVASVTLINSGVLLGYRWHALARIWRTPLLGELFQATTTRPAFRLLLKLGNPRGLPRDFVERMFDDYDAGTRRAVLRLYRATSHPDRAALALQQTLVPHRIPALVVWGRADPYIPPRQAELQRQTFDVKRVVMLERSGHWPFADDPDAVAAAVLPFLRARLGTG
jgi:pimeloyl-ACP methyl ester carboxylesterase